MKKKRRNRDKIEITPHAIDRFIERSGSKSTIRAISMLKKMLKEGEEVEIKDPIKRTKALLNHNLRLAEYLSWKGWILVIEEGKRLKTVHRGEAKVWKKKGDKSEK